MADKRDKIRFSLYLIDGVRCLYGLGVILTLGDPISTQASLLVLLRGVNLASTLHIPTRRDAR